MCEANANIVNVWLKKLVRESVDVVGPDKDQNQ